MDPRKIVMAEYHAWERNKPFCAKIKVSAFANFKVGSFDKEEEEREICSLAIFCM